MTVTKRIKIYRLDELTSDKQKNTKCNPSRPLKVTPLNQEKKINYDEHSDYWTRRFF